MFIWVDFSRDEHIWPADGGAVKILLDCDSTSLQAVRIVWMILYQHIQFFTSIHMTEQMNGIKGIFPFFYFTNFCVYIFIFRF